VHFVTECGELGGDGQHVRRSALRARHDLIDGDVEDAHGVGAAGSHQAQLRTQKVKSQKSKVKSGRSKVSFPLPSSLEQGEERAGADPAEEHQVDLHEPRERLERTQHEPTAREMGFRARTRLANGGGPRFR
jgi:hypothetical protein